VRFETRRLYERRSALSLRSRALTAVRSGGDRSSPHQLLRLSGRGSGGGGGGGGEGRKSARAPRRVVPRAREGDALGVAVVGERVEDLAEELGDLVVGLDAEEVELEGLQGSKGASQLKCEGGRRRASSAHAVECRTGMVQQVGLDPTRRERSPRCRTRSRRGDRRGRPSGRWRRP